MNRISLDHLALQTEGWSLHASTDVDWSWYDQNGHLVRARMFERPCPESTLEGWRERARAETSQGGGALVSFDRTLLDGCVAFRGLFKYPAVRCVPGLPAGSLAVYAVGMIAVPLGKRFLQINTEASRAWRHRLARGDLRDHVSAAAKPDRPPVRLEGQEALFNRFRECLALALPSDAEDFDTQVPTHPLSRVRATQRYILSTTRLGEPR